MRPAIRSMSTARASTRRSSTYWCVRGVMCVRACVHACEGIAARSVGRLLAGPPHRQLHLARIPPDKILRPTSEPLSHSHRLGPNCHVTPPFYMPTHLAMQSRLPEPYPVAILRSSIIYGPPAPDPVPRPLFLQFVVRPEDWHT